MTNPSALNTVRQPLMGTLIAIVLATAAGCVDAMGYLLLGGVLVAHMSGNTAVTAVSLQGGVWSKALGRISPLPGFLAGATLGNLLSRWLSKCCSRRALALGLFVELVLLAAFYALSWARPQAHVWGVTVLATAMGLQSATLRHVAKHDVRTTFITGMLVALVDESIDFLLRRQRRAWPGFHAGLWLGFFLGAFAAAWATARVGSSAILLAIALVSAAAVMAWGSSVSSEPSCEASSED